MQENLVITQQTISLLAKLMVTVLVNMDSHFYIAINLSIVIVSSSLIRDTQRVLYCRSLTGFTRTWITNFLHILCFQVNVVQCFNFISLQGLQWLQSATVLLSPDNKTITVTCLLSEASPQANCLATLNCTECRDHPFTIMSFDKSTQLSVIPNKHYVITVQAVRTDDGEPLETYTITKFLRIPKDEGISQRSDDQGTYDV